MEFPGPVCSDPAPLRTSIEMSPSVHGDNCQRSSRNAFFQQLWFRASSCLWFSPETHTSASLGNLLSPAQATHFSLEHYYYKCLLIRAVVDTANAHVLRLGPARLLTGFQRVTPSLLPVVETSSGDRSFAVLCLTLPK